MCETPDRASTSCGWQSMPRKNGSSHLPKLRSRSNGSWSSTSPAAASPPARRPAVRVSIAGRTFQVPTSSRMPRAAVPRAHAMVGVTSAWLLGDRMPKRRTRTVSRRAAEAAVQTLLRWAGDNPDREGLRDTPKRVANAYRDWFSGYSIDPGAYLRRTFEEVEGYDEMVVLRDISFESFCEHHMAPIIGRAHVGYLPTDRVVGISKLARVVDGYARRFQVQEKLTAQIAACINEVLKPRGVGVVIDAVHECMTTRGVHKRGVSMVTSKMLGTFRADASTRAEFLRFIAIEGSNQR